MWALLSTRFRRWAFTVVAIPATAYAARKVGEGIERRRGPNRVSRSLMRASSFLRPEDRRRRLR